jgi:hypothetical protein
MRRPLAVLPPNETSDAAATQVYTKKHAESVCESTHSHVGLRHPVALAEGLTEINAADGRMNDGLGFSFGYLSALLPFKGFARPAPIAAPLVQDAVILCEGSPHCGEDALVPPRSTRQFLHCGERLFWLQPVAAP